MIAFAVQSLVMSMMVSFVLSFFPRDVLDEILNLIESVSEDFPSYSSLDQIIQIFKLEAITHVHSVQKECTQYCPNDI